MEMINEQIEGVMVLKLSGRFDAYTASALKEFFQQMSADPTPRIVINLSDVNFIDSTGLATLTIGMQLCRQQHGDLVLCGIQQPVSVIFELTNLDKVFTISATEEAAITKIKNPQKGRSGNGHKVI